MTAVTEIRLSKADRVLHVAFDDGSRFALPAEYLRVESPSAEVQGHGPDQRQIVPGKRLVAIVGIGQDNDGDFVRGTHVQLGTIARCSTAMPNICFASLSHNTEPQAPATLPIGIQPMDTLHLAQASSLIMQPWNHADSDHEIKLPIRE